MMLRSLILALSLGAAIVEAQLAALGYAGIRGWWNDCSLDVDLCADAELDIFLNPLFLDFDTCYSNPKMAEKRGITFFGPDTLIGPIMYNILITGDAAALDTYAPTDCDPTSGACPCTANPTLAALREQILQDGTCEDSGTFYKCDATPFVPAEKECFVPSSVGATDEELICSMVASIQTYVPADDTTIAPVDATSTTVAPVAVVDSTLAPATVAPIGVDSTLAPATVAPAVTPATAAPSPTTTTLADLTAEGLNPDDPNNFDPDRVKIPDDAVEAYCTAITGWWSGCTGQDPTDYVCAGYDLTPINPLFLNFTACYANPAFNQTTVSVYGMSDAGDTKEIHLLLRKDNLPYQPTQCDANGACVCPQAIVDLKAAALKDPTKCDAMDVDVICEMRSFYGDTEECLVPTLDLIGNEFRCTLGARVKQFFPCNNDPPSESPTSSPVPTADGQVPDVPFDDVGQAIDEVKAEALGYTAITGWWNSCLARDDSNANDPCEMATNIRFEKPLYLNLDTCYMNPNLGHPHYSLSFFLKDAQGQPFAYHLLFESAAAFLEYMPNSCNDRGECSCGSSAELYDLRQSLMGAKDCSDGTGYRCKREVFIGFSNDCYVPVQETFAEGVTVCSMAASIEQIPLVNGPNTTALGPGPGEADQPKVPTDTDLNNKQSSASNGGNNNSGFPIWASVVIAIVCMFAFSFLVVGAIRYRRQGHFGSMHGGDEEENVWVRTGTHDSKFTRRALNTDEGDGVWKRENIHDLKFKVTT